MSTELTKRGIVPAPVRGVWDYDIGWAERETDLKKLRSQIKIMARQLMQYDDIDRHNRAENFRLRKTLDPFFDPELTLGEQVDLDSMVEARVVEWLERKGYTVSGKQRKRKSMVLIEARRDYRKR